MVLVPWPGMGSPEPCLDRRRQRTFYHKLSPICDVGEAQEVEGLWFSFSSALPLLRCIRSEAQQPRLVRVQRQAKTGQSFSQLAPGPLSFPFVLESQRNVVGIPHLDYRATPPWICSYESSR